MTEPTERWEGRRGAISLHMPPLPIPPLHLLFSKELRPLEQGVKIQMGTTKSREMS